MSDKPEPPLSDSEKQRVVRVFISSTFRDMHAERDELIKFIFPALRKKCRERQVEFVEVDLRWGITEEESAEGKVLPICLAEIKRCKPYFIGLLGERYGSLPDTIPQDIVDREPWLKEHLGKEGKSVTELEILHGVLNNPDMAAHAFFYFRDPAYIKSIPQDKQKDFTAEDSEGAEKLKTLKDCIRSKMPVRENYPDPKALGKRVFEDLWDVIDKKFPLEEVPPALERERMDHEAFAVARQKVYIGREAYFKRLDNHIASEDPPLVVLGESGSGKSALIANWIKKYRKDHPDDFMVTHYIGGTADSADYVKILRRIMEEIKAREDEKLGKKGGGEKEEGITTGSIGKEQDEIPSDPKKVVEQFPLWLAKAAARGRFILILDALNQLEDKDNAPDLGWLPEYFPPNVRVILSTLPVGKERDFTAKDAEGAKEQVWRRPHEALKRRGWPTLNVEPISPDERKKLIGEYLARFTRKLSDKLISQIATAQQTSNPLYLKALLDELRVYGYHESLELRINHYLKAKTVDDLYEKILERYEEDYECEGEQKGMVRRAMSLIWASRRGLSDTEIRELLGKDGQLLPRAYWSPLYLAAEESLVNRSGLLNFFHDFMRKAVENKYLNDKESKHASHLKLADYFDKKALDDRKVDELPWQLREAGEWKRLKDCLTNLEFFNILIQELEYELIGYWQVIDTRYDMVLEYQAVLQDYDKLSRNKEIFANKLIVVAKFFCVIGKYINAELLFRQALAIREKLLGKKHPFTVSTLANIAETLSNEGNYSEAEQLFRKALNINEKMLGKENSQTATILNNLAKVLLGKGNYEEAELLFRKALVIKEDIFGKDNLNTTTILTNLAELLSQKGNYKDAIMLFERVLSIRRKIDGEIHPDIAVPLNNLASVYYKIGHYTQAENLFRKALVIKEKMFGKDHPKTVNILNNLAEILNEKREYEDAEKLFRRCLIINVKALGEDNILSATILNNLAKLL